MSARFSRKFIVGWTGYAAAFALLIATAAILRADDDLKTRLKDHMASLAKKDGFSGAVLVMKDGQPLLREGYGKASYELDVPNTPETKFRLGSITKQFTAMAIMILAERGKLSPDDPISKHLENAPSAWDKITIRHLLTHTSGIPSYTGFPQMMTRTVRMPATLDEIIATFKDKDLEFQPGDKFTYSNSGYIVLGKIIERAAGESYETFLKENIFEPLEMSDSGYDHNGTLIKNRAAGYNRMLILLNNAPYIDMTWPHAAGALYSTVDDLGKWDAALSAGKLVSAESYKAIFTPFKGNYAYGWVVRERNGHKLIGHAGGIHGFSTSILRFPDDKLCVVVLNNVIPTRSEQVGLELADLVLGERKSESK
jgi:CubicO group peptidase (beta-lactamase class C family)